MRKQPQNFFDHYVQQLSNIFKEKGGTVNFVLVGACDGTNDNTIRDRFLPNSHWMGLFVEPMSLNFKSLQSFMQEQGAADRAHEIQAAVTDNCTSPTVTFKVPPYEEKNATLPHWMRRQIGAIVDVNLLTGKPKVPKGWKSEEVRCANGPELLREWTAAVKRPAAGKKNKK
jgi:hypothetical protein